MTKSSILKEIMNELKVTFCRELGKRKKDSRIMRMTPLRFC